MHPLPFALAIVNDLWDDELDGPGAEEAGEERAEARAACPPAPEADDPLPAAPRRLRPC